MATQAFEPPTDEDLRPRPSVGHMPFTGHRTVATVWAQQAAARKRRKSMDFGFDPESLKGGE